MHMPACLHQLEIIELNALDDALGAEKFKVKEGSLSANGAPASLQPT